jgi:hypothetical protein
MPMLKSDQFRKQLTAANKFIKLGVLGKGPSPSSMFGLENALKANARDATRSV